MNPITAWMLWLSTVHVGLAQGYTDWAEWLIDATEDGYD